MKNSISLVFVCVLFASCSNNKKQKINKEAEEENKQQNIAAWVKQEFDMMKDPATGTLDRANLWRILDEKISEANSNTSGMVEGIPNFTWNSVGPTDFGGRTRAMLISAADATFNTAFIGSVSGGIWKCTNLKSANPTWSPVNDSYGNLNIGSFAQDPNNANIIYVGTGEAFYGPDGLVGKGILKSVNAGLSFTFLPSTQNGTFGYVPALKVLSNGNILAATHAGLMQSIDGGTTWTRIFGGSNTRFGDLEIASNGNIFISTNGNIVDATYGEGCFKSTNNGASWTKLNTAASGMESVDGNIDYTELAVAPSNPAVVYATITKGNGYINVYKSTDGGSSWMALTKPSTTNYVNQGSFAVSMGVDPNNANTVLSGGLDLWRTTDAGVTWSSISTWYSHPSSLHADHHVVYFEPGNSNTCYFLTDGGIQRSNNANTNFPTYDEIGSGYVTLQFYAGAMTPTFNKFFFLGGTQDNGTWKVFPSSATQDIGEEVNGGDGGFTHIDQNEPNNKFCAYVYSNLYRTSSTDENLSGFASVNNPYSGKGAFINPSDYDDINNNMYLSSDAGKYLRWTNAPNTENFELVTVSAFGTANASCVHSSSIENNTVFFGLSNGQVIKTSAANIGTTNNTSIVIGGIAPRTNAMLNCIYQQPSDANRVIVSYSSSGGTGKVFITRNAGNGTAATWSNVTGNLPNIPVWSVIIDPNNPEAAVAGTEFGTYSTTDLTAIPVVWDPTPSMPNVRVTQLHTRASDKLLLASTYGRGLFVSDVFVTPVPFFSTNDTLTYIGKSVQFIDASLKATSWSWDFNNDGIYDSNNQNPTYLFPTAGVFPIKLRINGNNALVKTINVRVIENRGTPYTLLSGGDFETNESDFYPVLFSGSGFSRGNSTQAGKDGTRNSSANAWVIDINNPSYLSNSVAYLYTPSYNFTTAGSYDLSFYTKFGVESLYDGLIVEYTLNKGTTWNTLGNAIQSNWYNSSITSALFPASNAMFSNFINTYTKMNYNASSLAGNASVAFRFVFKSDGSVNQVGVVIDDFVLQGPSNIVLSIDKLSLTGKYDNGFAKLNCIVSNATDVKEYYVEESEDAQNFHSAGIVSSSTLNGNFTIQKNVPWPYAKTKMYFRLIGITNDGKKYYSNIISLTTKDIVPAFSIIEESKSNIKIESNFSSGNYALYNANGLFLQNGIISNGVANINMSQYAKAVYYFKVITNKNELLNKQFVLQ
jgi:hypothetical protein